MGRTIILSDLWRRAALQQVSGDNAGAPYKQQRQPLAVTLAQPAVEIAMARAPAVESVSGEAAAMDRIVVALSAHGLPVHKIYAELLAAQQQLSDDQRLESQRAALASTLRRAGLASHQRTIVEFGSGDGALSRSLRLAGAAGSFLLVDRSKKRMQRAAAGEPEWADGVTMRHLCTDILGALEPEALREEAPLRRARARLGREARARRAREPAALRRRLGVVRDAAREPRRRERRFHPLERGLRARLRQPVVQHAAWRGRRACMAGAIWYQYPGCIFMSTTTITSMPGFVNRYACMPGPDRYP